MWQTLFFQLGIHIWHILYLNLKNELWAGRVGWGKEKSWKIEDVTKEDLKGSQ